MLGGEFFLRHNVKESLNDGRHGLRTLNEGINLKKLVQCGRQNLLRPYLQIWEWELIFGRAVKAISSSGVRSPDSDERGTKQKAREIKGSEWKGRQGKGIV